MRVRFTALPCLIAVSSFALVAPAAFGADSPVNGQTLFAGNPVQACTACHGNVDNRRNAIDPGGDVDFDLALARFLNAIAVQSVMMPFNNGLTTQQKRDIAAYIADVPKARPNLVDFAATSTNSETAPTTITFSNAVTASAPLTINTVGLTGASTEFLIKTAGTTCANNLVLAPGQTCDVSVTFRTSTSSNKTALLNIAYTQSAVQVNRTAQLSGTVGNQPPPSSASGGGGGALPAGWLALFLVALGLRRRDFSRL